jgi:hypothetical protein
MKETPGVQRSESAHTLNVAVIAYTGHGQRKIPKADEDAVLALSPTDGEALLRAVKEVIRRSDTIRFSDVAPFDTDLQERLHGRLHDLVPHLGPDAIEALGWRWGYLNLA